MSVNFVFLATCLLLAVASHVTESSELLKRLLEGREWKDRRSDEPPSELKNAAKKPNINVDRFLEKFGYLPKMKPGVSHDHGNRKRAISHFQKMYHLERTGVLDSDTMAAMAAPRCGMEDTQPVVYTSLDETGIGKRFFVPGNYKWQKTDLTYKFRNFASSKTLDQATQKRAVAEAFKLWSDVTPLTFRETSEDQADFNLEFAIAAHNDGQQNAFDGPGGVLAHAFYPESGETHFDDQEIWVDRESEGIDLMTVAAHEFGHALGIGHSDVAGALMAPYYQGYDPEFTLPQDDINAVQSLYGPRPADKATVRPPRPQTTARSTYDGTPNSCSVVFRAVTQIDDNSIMVFNENLLWRLNDGGLINGYPVETRSLYRYAPSNVDAAIFSRRTAYTYLFYGRTVWQYYGFRLVSGHRFSSRFGGSITDAATDSRGNIYLIKGRGCWLFNENNLSVSTSSQPCTQVFPGWPSTDDFDSTLQLTSYPNSIFIFKGDSYWKFNTAIGNFEVGYPKEKAGAFMGPACNGNPYSPK